MTCIISKRPGLPMDEEAFKYYDVQIIDVMKGDTIAKYMKEASCASFYQPCLDDFILTAENQSTNLMARIILPDSIDSKAERIIAEQANWVKYIGVLNVVLTPPPLTKGSDIFKLSSLLALILVDYPMLNIVLEMEDLKTWKSVQKCLNYDKRIYVAITFNSNNFCQWKGEPIKFCSISNTNGVEILIKYGISIEANDLNVVRELR